MIYNTKLEKITLIKIDFPDFEVCMLHSASLHIYFMTGMNSFCENGLNCCYNFI